MGGVQLAHDDIDVEQVRSDAAEYRHFGALDPARHSGRGSMRRI